MAIFWSTCSCCSMLLRYSYRSSRPSLIWTPLHGCSGVPVASPADHRDMLLETGHQYQLVGPAGPGAMGRPTVAPELQNAKADMPGAVCLARPCAPETYHPAAARHPGQQEGHHCPLEAGHSGQLLLSGTLSAVVMQVVHAMNDILFQGIIRLQGTDTTVAGFAALGFPNCGGAMDATHIPICAPEHRVPHFY